MVGKCHIFDTSVGILFAGAFSALFFGGGSKMHLFRSSTKHRCCKQHADGGALLAFLRNYIPGFPVCARGKTLPPGITSIAASVACKWWRQAPSWPDSNFRELSGDNRLVCCALQRFPSCALAQVSAKGFKPCHHTGNVAFHHGMFFSKGDAQNCVGGVLTDAAQALEYAASVAGNVPPCSRTICCAAACKFRARL